jgi:hypothetical protein
MRLYAALRATRLHTPDYQDHTTQTPLPNTEWLSNSSNSTPSPNRNRRVVVSIDTKILPSQVVAATHDEEGTKAPLHIPAWVPSQEDLESLMTTGAGAAPDIIYARGVSADPFPEIDPFNHNDCPLIFFEIGF